MLAEDGVVVDLVDGRASIVGEVPCGYVYVDGLSVGDITEASLKDRRILGEEGFISVFVVVDSATGKVVAGPEIHARGFAERRGRSTRSGRGSRRRWPRRRRGRHRRRVPAQQMVRRTGGPLGERRTTAAGR